MAKKKTERARTGEVTPDHVRSLAKSAERLASTLNSIAVAIDFDHFDGAVNLTGSELMKDNLAKLHELASKLHGRYMAALSTWTPPAPKIVPESIPDNVPNTRKSDAERRVLSDPTTPKKTPKQP